MLKQTFLYQKHKELGAKFTEFSGWDMPVQYSSIIEEHNVVRINLNHPLVTSISKIVGIADTSIVIKILLTTCVIYILILKSI